MMIPWLGGFRVSPAATCNTFLRMVLLLNSILLFLNVPDIALKILCFGAGKSEAVKRVELERAYV